MNVLFQRLADNPDHSDKKASPPQPQHAPQPAILTPTVDVKVGR